MNEKMKSRKLWFFGMLTIMFTIMQAKGFIPIDGVVYSNLMFGVLIGFAGGNVGDKFAQRGR